MDTVNIEEGQPLIATESDSTGQFEIQIISPGIGSSGIYPTEVLQAAVKDRVWGRGLQLFIDHPTEAEQADRPERSVRDLAGALVEDARWDDSRQAVVAKARVYSMYRPLVKEAAQDIGMSIRASAEVHEGMHEGHPARFIDRVTEGYSVDFVTRAGRGGAVLSVLESARAQLLANETTPPVPDQTASGQHTTASTPKELNMPEITEADKALVEARSQVAALEAERDQLTQRAETAEARAEKAEADLTARDLKATATTRAAEAVKDLPEAMAGRILAGLLESLPTTDAGALDEAAFDTKLAEAVKAEQDYAAAVAPKGITGFGASTQANESTTSGPRINAWGREIKEA